MIPVGYVVTCPDGTWNQDIQLEKAKSVFNVQQQHRPPIIILSKSLTEDQSKLEQNVG